MKRGEVYYADLGNATGSEQGGDETSCHYSE